MFRRPVDTSSVRASTGGLALAATVPLVCLHAAFQPDVSLSSVDVTMADVAVLAVVALAFSRGVGELAHARAIWLATAALLAWIAAASVYPRFWDGSYAVGSHLVSAAKFAEYALLAPAVVLLLRRRVDLLVFLGALVAWSVVCTVVGLVQFLGLDVLHAWPSGSRQPSLLGVHEFAAFSAAVFAIGLAGVAAPPPERRARLGAVVAVVSGGLGLVLGGAVAAGIGVGLAAAGVCLVALRRRTLTLPRLAAGAAAVGLCAVGLLAMRSGDIGDFTRASRSDAPSANVETYSQRALMSYVAYRIWRGRPLQGAGWQAVWLPAAFEPYLPAARAKFPEQPPLAFPSPEHPYPVDNAYLQALAELGVVGAALLLALVAVSLVAAARAALRGSAVGLAALAILLVVVGAWTGQGLVVASPYDFVVWVGVGLAALAHVEARRARA